MKVTSEKVENRQAYLTIEMEPAEVEESLEKAYRRLVKNRSVPGFRKGKAPRAIFERYLGRENLLENALDALIPEAFQKAAAEKSIEVFGQPVVEVVQKEPLVFKAVVPLKPTVKLGDYRSIRSKPEPVNVTEENMSAALEGLRHQHATWEPVERPIREYDLLSLDANATVEGQSYFDHKNGQHQVIPGFPLPAPGFSEALVGMKQDEEKRFKLKFPPDYPQPGLAGKEADFRVKILEIKWEKLPELSDEFAKVVAPELKDIAGLREKVREGVKAQLERQARSEFEDKLVQMAVSQSQIEYPPALVEMQIDQLMSERMRELGTDERGFREYLKTIKKTEPELREEMRPFATKRVVNSLLLGELSREEKITVAEDEVASEIGNLVKSAASDKQEELQRYLNTPDSKESVHDIILTRKTIEKLVASAIQGSEENKETQEEKK